MPREPPGRSAGAAAVLRWCSPQSSAPRQTVGHHAKAAMYEMGPTAACEGCRGEVPMPRLAPDSPPAGVFFPFSYTHRPGRSGLHGPAGSGVDFPIPQNSFVWVLLKMGSRARDHKTVAARRPDAARPHAGPRKPATPVPRVASGSLARPAPLCLLPSHIPTDQGAVACMGRRALVRDSRSRRTRLYGFR